MSKEVISEIKVQIDNWPDNFADWCANCEVLRALIEGDVFLDVSKKGYEGVTSVKATPECFIDKKKSPLHNSHIRYDRILQNGEDRKKLGYEMYDCGIRVVTVDNKITCPAKRPPKSIHPETF